MVYPAFARRQVFWQGGRPRSVALFIATSCAALAALIVSWLVLAPVKARLPVAVPAITLKYSLPAGAEKPPKASEAMLDGGCLERALVAVDYSGARTLGPVALARLAERVRPAIEVEALADDAPEPAGTAAITIRWLADPRIEGAAGLVDALAREWTAKWQTEIIARDEQAAQAASRALATATAKVQKLQTEFDAALTRLDGSGDVLSNAPHAVSNSGGPTLAPAEPPSPAKPIAAARGNAAPATARITHVASSSRQARLESELEDLEIKRDSLGERYTSSHPEMRALEEQIAEVRAALANTSYPITEEPLPPPSIASTGEPPAEAPRPTVVAPSAAPWRRQLLTEAQAAWRRLSTAIVAREGAAQAAGRAQAKLAEVRGAAAIERLPAAGPAPVVAVSWPLAVLALFAAGCAGWLTLCLWPTAGAVVRDADELRRTTRLPVIVVPALAPSSADSKWRLRPAFAECMQSADRSPARQTG